MSVSVSGNACMNTHAVVIAGGGPVGMMLAGELALAGVDVAIVERRSSPQLAGSRAGGLHARSIEVLDQRGIAGRFLAEGQQAQVVGFASVRLDISDFPTRHPYTLGLWQNHIERLLAEWVGELGVRVYRDCEVSGFVQDDAGVGIALADGRSLRAEYLVGCDGGRSVVRKTADIEFAGVDATSSNLIAEVEMRETPPLGIHRSALGTYSFGRLEYEIRNGEIIYKDTGPIKLMLPEAQIGSGEPTLAELSAALIAICGTDYGVHSPTWISRFTDMARQAVTYRDRRVLLAGDAAHIHSPVSGQGLNTGLQDAVNLGWKLAQVVKRISPPELLDTYHAERHPVGARVLRNTMAQSVLTLRPDARANALREVLAELVDMDEPRKRMAAMMSGLDIRYDFGDADFAGKHPLLGRRMPDLDLHTADGSLRLYALLHEAQPVLFNFGEAGSIDIAPWAGRVWLVDANCADPWELPAIGVVSAPGAVLIRPDGHVAWVGNGSDAGLREALGTWFGRAIG